MIVALLITVILGVLTAVTSFLPTVTELPLGIGNALSMFSHTLHGIFSLLPWLEIVWEFLIFALGIKFLLFVWHWVRYIISLVRG